MTCAMHITNDEVLYTHKSQGKNISYIECSYTWHEVIFYT